MYSRQNGQYPVPAPVASDSAPPPPPGNHTMPISNCSNERKRNYSGTKNGRVYTLRVEQQPVRARMCGFGDKDRRPITPPPCIRLLVTDAATGAEVTVDENESNFYTLTVDLWDQDGNHEVNLVRHSSGAPTLSISNSTTTSYPPPQERQAVYLMQSTQPAYRDPYGQAVPPSQQPGNPYAAPAPIGGAYYGQTPTTPVTAGGYQYPSQPSGSIGYAIPMTSITAPTAPATATGMFTRNLIGQLAVSACRLTDTEAKPGIWFVLQDLSVRTEGMFRLKMNFVNIANPDGSGTLNTGNAPVLATCFSEMFQVYSAKKFPGVIESTPLSKCFASQGIKIPIRKDGPKPIANREEYDNEEI